MIHSVKITDFSTIKKLADQNSSLKENLWITAIDPEDKKEVNQLSLYFKKHFIPHHVEYFYDVDDKDLNSSCPPPAFTDQPPQKRHIKNIIQFLTPYVQSPEPFHLGVNCFAGVSRSTAIGIVAWILQGYTPLEAWDSILKNRWQAHPNLRILRLASEILKQDILTPISREREKNVSSLITPYGGYEL